MTLTEEQKRNIEEEEEYRAKLRSEKSGSEKKKTHTKTAYILVFLVILGFGFLHSIFSSSPTSNTNPSASQKGINTGFKAEVTFTDTEFRINNLDGYDCIDPWMSVNHKYFLKGYTLKNGQTSTVATYEFTDTNRGTIFYIYDPYTVQPKSFQIVCGGNNELSQHSWSGLFYQDGYGYLDGIFSSSPTSNMDLRLPPQKGIITGFKSEVTLKGTQFGISNLDRYDCIDPWMSVNHKYFLKGYTLKKGKTYMVGAGEFTGGDNTPFNPFTVQPVYFDIECQGNNELSQPIPHLWLGSFYQVASPVQ